MRLRALLTAFVTGTLLSVVPVVSAGATAAPAVIRAASMQPSATKVCSATMSVPNPKQHTTTTVRVSRLTGGAAVTAVAHYKSKNTPKTAGASAAGLASLPFAISTATRNYRVTVTVTAVRGSVHWACTTSFLPR